MNEPTRIYLDNAATSWPKPEAVYAAVNAYQREHGAAAGRSAYADADHAQRLVTDTRHSVAEMIGATSSNRVVFTFNGTDALNLALHGLLRDGDHVVTTVVEHNSILRPLKTLEQSAGIEVTRVECDAEGRVQASAIRDALRPQTALVAMIHASNVTGALQPVTQVAEIVQGHGARLLVDAAQSLGHVPLDVNDLPIDLLAAPGHKGLLGPLGTGLLYVAPGVEQSLQSVRQGGTGTESEVDQQPEELPEKYESGNLNVVGLAGLQAGLTYLGELGIDAIRRQESELTSQLLDKLSRVPRIRIHGPPDTRDRVGVVSFSLPGFDPQEIAAVLDASFHIQVRSGLHCAPLLHRAIGTFSAGGTVRISSGPFTTADHIDALCAALTEIATSR